MKTRVYGEPIEGLVEVWDGDALICSGTLTVRPYQNQIHVGPTHNSGESAPLPGTTGTDCSLEVDQMSDAVKLLPLHARNALLRFVLTADMALHGRLIESDSGYTRWRVNVERQS